MKKLKIFALLGSLSLAVILVSCSTDDAVAPSGNSGSADAYGSETGIASVDLSSNEKVCLLTLLEKQKLHRDLYDVMLENSQNEVFSMLSQSDETLMELLSIKADRYAIENPVLYKLPGEYDDSQIQAVYENFVQSKEFGLNQMLIYAQEMESEMIDEIHVHLAGVSGNPDIAQIYKNLIDKSEDQLEILLALQ